MSCSKCRARQPTRKAFSETPCAELNVKKDEMEDLRHQLSQGLARVYGQVNALLFISLPLSTVRTSYVYMHNTFCLPPQQALSCCSLPGLL